MVHVFTVYFTAMAKVFWISGAAEGKIDPAQPDAVVGPLAMAPELGPTGLTEADLNDGDIRTRMWMAKNIGNRASLARHYGGLAALEALL